MTNAITVRKVGPLWFAYVNGQILMKDGVSRKFRSKAAALKAATAAHLPRIDLASIDVWAP